MGKSLNLFSTFLFLLFLMKPSFSIQSYDPTNCSTSIAQLPGSTYLCNSNTKSCRTFIVYRAQHNQNLSTISSLFKTNESQLNSSQYNLGPGGEVIVPVSCECPDRSSQAIFTYNNSNSYSLSRIACEVYEGLVKAQILTQQNANNHEMNLVQVPVKCACTNNASDDINGTKYLVAYPIIETDTIDLIAKKFGVTPEMILDANGLEQRQTIFAQTTLLIPTKGVPVVNSDVIRNDQSPREVIPLEEISKGRTRSPLTVRQIASIISAVVSLLVVFLFLVFIKRRYCHKKISDKGSELSHFSPDFLDGMSKLKQSLISFSIDELRFATQDFSEESLIGKSVYRGQMGGFRMAIEEMISVESAYHVIYILTKINHFNVVKIEGCCFHGNMSFLVFEFATHCSLRDCLANSKTRKQLTWAKRMQIAFELAEGLHYIHYCTKPTYVHRNISSRNVLITSDYRAKISGFKLARPVIYSTGVEGDSVDWTESIIVGKKGYLAPEYLDNGRASTKVDVYAYGVVLLEILSAKEVMSEGKWLKDSVGFLADGEVGMDSSGCLEKFKVFMDPVLEGEYSLGDAMCLALLAKCCTQDDPQNRPTMNDVLKALSRIV